MTLYFCSACLPPYTLQNIALEYWLIFPQSSAMEFTHQYSREDFARIARRIWANLKADGFEGSDPYDGLNSLRLTSILGRSRLARLVVIQAVKRSPVNLRPLLGVPRGLNPKGLALMLQGAAEWLDLGDTSWEQTWLADALVSLASNPDGTSISGSREILDGAAVGIADGTLDWPAAAGWGYHFPWQSKAFLQPAYFPTVVASSFALDGLEAAGSPALPKVASAVATFVADHLYRYKDNDGICFSYSPGDRSRVYNASLFGAKILAQAAPHVPSRQAEWQDLSRQAVDWVVARQAADGSWICGEANHWQWIDNLHTGFNLETIDRVAQLLGTSDWDDNLSSGLAFYRQKLFDSDATPRYYTSSRFPLDPHSFAQGALTFLRLSRFESRSLDFAGRILARGVDELWDERRGGFRFQKHRHYAQSTIHMRWSQAWMFRALCAYLKQPQAN